MEDSIFMQILKGQDMPKKILFWLIVSIFPWIEASTIAYWSFENTLTSSVGGSALTGTPQGTPTFSPDIASSAPGSSSLSLSGSSYVKLDGTSHVTGNLSALTIEAYIKINSQPSNLYTIYSEDSTLRSTYLGYQDNNTIRFFVKSGSIAPIVSGVEVLDAPITLAINTWYHLAAVFDGNAQTLAVYVDGTLIGSRSVSATSIPSTSVVPTIGGWSYTLGGLLFSGKIDELKLSDEALAPSQFVNTVPEFSSWLLLLLGIGCLSARHIFFSL